MHLQRQSQNAVRVRRQGELATTLKEGLVVGIRSMPGNPYDGHTLAETIEQVSILADARPTTVIVERGYRGMPLKDIRILMSGQRAASPKP